LAAFKCRVAIAPEIKFRSSTKCEQPQNLGKKLAELVSNVSLQKNLTDRPVPSMAVRVLRINDSNVDGNRGLIHHWRDEHDEVLSGGLLRPLAVPVARIRFRWRAITMNPLSRRMLDDLSIDQAKIAAPQILD
jgi:hypothetical protein